MENPNVAILKIALTRAIEELQSDNIQSAATYLKFANERFIDLLSTSSEVCHV